MTGHSSIERVGADLALVLGAAYGTWIGVVQASADRAGPAAALAAGVLYLTPGLAAFAALAARSRVWHRAGLVLAGILALLASLSSLAGVTLPLMIPAILLLLAAARPHRREGVSA